MSEMISALEAFVEDTARNSKEASSLQLELMVKVAELLLECKSCGGCCNIRTDRNHLRVRCAKDDAYDKMLEELVVEKPTD